MMDIKRRLKKSARKLGLFAQGDFLVALRNADIISGIAIDSAPERTYIWTFILPSYDLISFPHMTLGKRVFECDETNACIMDAYNSYLNDVAEILTASDLVEYIERNELHSSYAEWAKYLSQIRSDNLDEAEKSKAELSARKPSKDIAKKIERIEMTEKALGRNAVQNLLTDWQTETDFIFKDVPKDVIPPPLVRSKV